MRRGEIHPEVRAILDAIQRDVVLALRRDGRADLAVVVDAGREGFELPSAVAHETGVRWTLMPRAEALAIGEAHTLEAGELLREELEAGSSWCLVLGPRGAAAVPLVQPGARRAVPKA